MKVFAVYAGCMYEGTSLERLFLSKESAGVYAAKIQRDIDRNVRIYNVHNLLIQNAWKKLGKYVRIDTLEITDRLLQAVEFSYGYTDICVVLEEEVFE